MATPRPPPAAAPEDLLGFIARHQRLRAPIYHLPAEILFEVSSFLCRFWHVYPDEPEGLWRGPLSLIPVCRFWRSIIESHSDLWTFVPFVMSRQHQKLCFFDTPSILDMWLSRSRDLPLNVIIYSDGGLGHEDDLYLEKTINQVIPSLVVSSYRWKTLELDTGTCPDWMPTVQLPALEKFEVNLWEDHLIQAYIPLISNRPHLRELILFLNDTAVEYQELLRPFLAASTQLSKLDISGQGLDIHEIDDLLAMQPCLEYLKVYRITFGSDMPSNVVSHSSLSKIMISDFDTNDTADSRFDGLVLSNLKKCNLPGLPVSAGSALLHHLITMVKGGLRNIRCHHCPHRPFSHHIHFFRDYSCDIQSANPLSCDREAWIDSLLGVLGHSAWRPFVVFLSIRLDPEQLLFWRSSIYQLLCSTLRKYAEKGRYGASLSIGIGIRFHYQFSSSFKELIESLRRDIENNLGEQILQPWSSTTYSDDWETKAVLHFSPDFTNTYTFTSM
ncbi:hypothetical protein DL96DRAFT_1816917 [Flagelloscypha sp. PMI_526]|nr:hypothetical protein DL96DRAFT_1816917 [Flagelloscypha sp. PMI_526]